MEVAVTGAVEIVLLVEEITPSPDGVVEAGSSVEKFCGFFAPKDL